MQGHYQQISMDERRRIYLLLGQKKRPQEIAALLGRHRSTIYREINRNTYSHEEEFARGYFPVTANDLGRFRT